MSQMKWERIAALTGLVSAALVAVRTLISPTPPLTGTVEDLTGFFADQGGAVRMTVYLTGFVVVAGTWFFAGVRSYLARHGEERVGTIVFGAWLLTGVLAMVRFTFVAVPAISVPESAPVMYLLAGIMSTFVWITSFASAAGMAFAGVRSKAFPSWFIGVNVLAAIIFLIGGSALIFTDGLFAMSGDFKTVVIWTWTAWTALASIVLFSRVSAEGAPSAQG